MKVATEKSFDQISVCPICNAPTKEKHENTVCSDGCGNLEGFGTINKFVCPDCGDFCNEEKCKCENENN